MPDSESWRAGLWEIGNPMYSPDGGQTWGLLPKTPALEKKYVIVNIDYVGKKITISDIQDE